MPKQKVRIKREPITIRIADFIAPQQRLSTLACSKWKSNTNRSAQFYVASLVIVLFKGDNFATEIAHDHGVKLLRRVGPEQASHRIQSGMIRIHSLATISNKKCDHKKLS
jgi:hypothetical protein